MLQPGLLGSSSLEVLPVHMVWDILSPGCSEEEEDPVVTELSPSRYSPGEALPGSRKCHCAEHLWDSSFGVSPEPGGCSFELLRVITNVGPLNA